MDETHRAPPSLLDLRFTYAFLLICGFIFVFSVTSSQVANIDVGGGLAPLIRTSSAFALFVLFSFCLQYPLRLNSLVLVLFLIFVFILPNLASPSFYFILGISNLLIAGLLASYSRFNRDVFLFVSTVFVVFHLSGLIAQLSIFMLSGIAVDLHQILFPYSSARLGEHIGQMRLTGFQIEPGNYAQGMYMMVLFRAILRERIANRLDALAMLSALVTLSAWAVVGLAFWLLALILEGLAEKGEARRRTITLLTLVGLPALTIGSGLVAVLTGADQISYLIVRLSFEQGSGSSSDKLLALFGWTASIDLSSLLPKPMRSTFCDSCQSPQDLGILFTLTYYLGIPVGIFVISLFSVRLLKIGGFAMLILSIPFYITKFFYYDFFPWLIFFTAIIGAGAKNSPRAVHHHGSRKGQLLAVG